MILFNIIIPSNLTRQMYLVRMSKQQFKMASSSMNDFNHLKVKTM